MIGVLRSRNTGLLATIIAIILVIVVHRAVIAWRGVGRYRLATSYTSGVVVVWVGVHLVSVGVVVVAVLVVAEWDSGGGPACAAVWIETTLATATSVDASIVC